MSDERLPRGEPPERITLRPPPALVEALIEAYPPDEYPEIENLQQLILRAASDAVRERQDS